MQIEERTEAKKCFSRIGWYVFSIFLLTNLIQFLVVKVVSTIWPNAFNYPIALWICTYGPMYLIAVPLSFLVIKELPIKKVEQKKMAPAQFLCCIPIALFLMYAGNIVGLLLMTILKAVTGIQIMNPLDMIINSPVYIRLLVAVIIGPFMEEFIFRKQIIDHTRMYGEKAAIVVSAVLFGLFHGNLSQMFYACALGMLLGYLYVRTGTIRYGFYLHMFVNFLGGIVAPFFLQMLQKNGSGILSLSMGITEEQIAAYLVFMAYTMVLFLGGVLGLILFFLNRKKVYFVQEEKELPKEEIWKIVFLNTGMFLFYILIVISVLKTMGII